jgi:hypothetical protein
MRKTQTIIPILILLSGPEKCPFCHKPEDQKIVCRHCGYEYKDDSWAWYDWAKLILILIFIIFIIWLLSIIIMR